MDVFGPVLRSRGPGLLRVAVRLVPTFTVANVTVLVNPFLGVTVTVEMPVPPFGIRRESGVALISKSGGEVQVVAARLA